MLPVGRRRSQAGRNGAKRSRHPLRSGPAGGQSRSGDRRPHRSSELRFVHASRPFSLPAHWVVGVMQRRGPAHSFGVRGEARGWIAKARRILGASAALHAGKITTRGVPLPKCRRRDRRFPRHRYLVGGAARCAKPMGNDPYFRPLGKPSGGLSYRQSHLCGAADARTDRGRPTALTSSKADRL